MDERLRKRLVDYFEDNGLEVWESGYRAGVVEPQLRALRHVDLRGVVEDLLRVIKEEEVI